MTEEGYLIIFENDDADLNNFLLYNASTSQIKRHFS